MASIINSAVSAVLNAAEYKGKSKVIPNDHPRILPHIEHLPAIAEDLGIDFAKTGYTFKVVKPKDGGLIKIITPGIGVYEGKVCLQWGNVFTPINQLKGAVSVGLEGKRVLLDVETEKDFYRFVGYTRKDKTTDDMDVKRRLKANTLHEVVDDVLIIPASLADLKPNEMYDVVGYKVGGYEGKKTYSLQLKGLGFYSANSNIINRLADEPEITADKPGKIMTGVVENYTKQGYPIVPIMHFSTYAETELEPYTFD